MRVDSKEPRSTSCFRMQSQERGERCLVNSPETGGIKGMLCFTVLCFLVFHRCCFFLQIEGKQKDYDSLYCGHQELNSYLPGMPVAQENQDSEGKVTCQRGPATKKNQFWDWTLRLSEYKFPILPSSTVSGIWSSSGGLPQLYLLLCPLVCCLTCQQALWEGQEVRNCSAAGLPCLPPH